MDPVTMGLLASAAGSIISGAMQKDTTQFRLPYTGAAAPQGNLANSMELIRALLPGLVEKAQTPPHLTDDNFDFMSGPPHAISLMARPNSAGPTAAPTRKAINAVPGLDMPWGASTARSPTLDATFTGIAKPKDPNTDASQHIPTPISRTSITGGPAMMAGSGGNAGGIDARTMGALQLLQHAATMGAPQGRRAA